MKNQSHGSCSCSQDRRGALAQPGTPPRQCTFSNFVMPQCILSQCKICRMNRCSPTSRSSKQLVHGVQYKACVHEKLVKYSSHGFDDVLLQLEPHFACTLEDLRCVLMQRWLSSRRLNVVADS